MNAPYEKDAWDHLAASGSQSDAALISIAISLKRIADAMSNNVPVNCYGESFTDAIQNSFVRGQRGISTWGD